MLSFGRGLIRCSRCRSCGGASSPDASRCGIGCTKCCSRAFAWRKNATSPVPWPAALRSLRCTGKKAGPNPTDRGKAGSKHHLLSAAQGVPLSIILTEANPHDVTSCCRSWMPMPGPIRRPKLVQCRRVNFSSISYLSRRSVHNSVVKPCASAPPFSNLIQLGLLLCIQR